MPSTRKAVLIKLPLFILCTTFLAALVALLLVHRSFSRAALKRGLEGAIAGQAEIGAFHSRYFPPGCVAEGVSLRQGSQPGPPLIAVSKLSFHSTLAGLISGRRVSIRADGMRVSVPESGSREPIKLSSHSNVRIIEFTAENSVLEIGRSDKLPLRFLVHELKLHNIATGSRLLFNVRLTNPEPPAKSAHRANLADGTHAISAKRRLAESISFNAPIWGFLREFEESSSRAADSRESWNELACGAIPTLLTSR